jgi:hypothetical protein
MSIVKASDLVRTNFSGFSIPGFEKIIGLAQGNTSIFVWGPKYSGKSTISIALAKGLAKVNGTVLYCSSEEGAGATMKDKIERMEAGVPNLLVGDFHGLQQLKSDVRKHKAKALVLDSAHMAHMREKDHIDLYEWCKHEGVFFIVVNHATKEGKFKGSSMLAHMVDVELRIEDGTIFAEKNRLPHDIDEMKINFDQRGKTKRSARENPVPVPFKITLAEIAKKHSIRGIKRLNDMVDFTHSCTVDRNPVSFRYKRQNMQSYLEMLSSGKVIHTHCASDFITVWRKMVKEIGSTVIEIKDQAHAKKVLGAAEYRRQEKQTQPAKPKAERKAKATQPAAARSYPVEDARKQSIPDGAILRGGKSADGKAIEMIQRGSTYQLKKSGKIVAESSNGDNINSKYDALRDGQAIKGKQFQAYKKYPEDKVYVKLGPSFDKNEFDQEVNIYESMLKEMNRYGNVASHKIKIVDENNNFAMWEGDSNKYKWPKHGKTKSTSQPTVRKISPKSKADDFDSKMDSLEALLTKAIAS